MNDENLMNSINELMYVIMKFLLIEFITLLILIINDEGEGALATWKVTGSIPVSGHFLLLF